MQIYSKDLRIRAVDAVERGIPRKEVVEMFCISLTTLKRWIKMRRAKTSRPGSPQEGGDASFRPPKRRGPWGSSSKRTTMPPLSATASYSNRRRA
jgi:transposase